MFSSSTFFVNQPISSATNHENTAFKARPNTLRESGSFSCSELFISTNHCTASAAFCPALSAFSLKPLPFLCLWTDLHEIRNLSFFRQVTLNRAVIFQFCLFVCLLPWTQLHCSLIGFDFLCSSFLWSNERSFWCLFAIFYRLYLSSCAAICNQYLLQFVFSSPFFIEVNDMCLSFKIWYSRIWSVIFAPPPISPRISRFSCLVMG